MPTFGGKHYMNPAFGRHVSGQNEPDQIEGHGKMPQIFIHSHEDGHTVHIHHPDGRHEMHHHQIGDTDGVAQHIHEHLNPNREGGTESGYEESLSEATE